MDEVRRTIFWIDQGLIKYASIKSYLAGDSDTHLDGKTLSLPDDAKAQCICIHEDKLLASYNDAIFFFDCTTLELLMTVTVEEKVKAILSQGEAGGCVIGEEGGLYHLSADGSAPVLVCPSVLGATTMAGSPLVAYLNPDGCLFIYSTKDKRTILEFDLASEWEDWSAQSKDTSPSMHFASKSCLMLGIGAHVHILTIKDNKVAKWQSIEDPARETTGGPHHFIFATLPAWNAELSQLTLIADGASPDIVCGGLLAGNKEQQDLAFQMFYIVSEEGLMQLPLSKTRQGEDSVPMAMVLDFGGDKELAASDPDAPLLPPQPIVHIVNSDGILCSFHIVNEHAPHPLIKSKPVVDGKISEKGMKTSTNVPKSVVSETPKSITISETPKNLTAPVKSPEFKPFGFANAKPTSTLASSPISAASDSSPKTPSTDPFATVNPAPSIPSTTLSIPTSTTSTLEEIETMPEQLLAPELALLTEDHGLLQNAIASQFIEVHDAFKNDLTRTRTVSTETKGKMDKARPMMVIMDKMNDDLAVMIAKVEAAMKAITLQSEQVQTMMKDVSLLKAQSQVKYLQTLGDMPSLLTRLHGILDEIETKSDHSKNGKGDQSINDGVVSKLEEMLLLIKSANAFTPSTLSSPRPNKGERVAKLHQMLRARPAGVPKKPSPTAMRATESVLAINDLLAQCVPVPKPINLPPTEPSTTAKPIPAFLKSSSPVPSALSAGNIIGGGGASTSTSAGLAGGFSFTLSTPNTTPMAKPTATPSTSTNSSSDPVKTPLLSNSPVKASPTTSMIPETAKKEVLKAPAQSTPAAQVDPKPTFSLGSPVKADPKPTLSFVSPAKADSKPEADSPFPQPGKTTSFSFTIPKPSDGDQKSEQSAIKPAEIMKPLDEKASVVPSVDQGKPVVTPVQPKESVGGFGFGFSGLTINKETTTTPNIEKPKDSPMVTPPAPAPSIFGVPPSLSGTSPAQVPSAPSTSAAFGFKPSALSSVVPPTPSRSFGAGSGTGFGTSSSTTPNTGAPSPSPAFGMATALPTFGSATSFGTPSFGQTTSFGMKPPAPTSTTPSPQAAGFAAYSSGAAGASLFGPSSSTASSSSNQPVSGNIFGAASNTVSKEDPNKLKPKQSPSFTQFR